MVLVDRLGNAKVHGH